MTHDQYLVRLFLFLLLSIPSALTTDQYRVVAPGPCSHQGDAYCAKRVANSICSKAKDECFCKPGFVSIQESFGIACKTLLTNIKCQLDSDCVHVVNSACHPGAGLCACPSETIYVAQLHACYHTVTFGESSFCQKCHQMNGLCYRNGGRKIYRLDRAKIHVESIASDWRTKFGYTSLDYELNDFGCNCPHNTAMPLAVPSQVLLGRRNDLSTDLSTHFEDKLSDTMSTSLPQPFFCKAVFVDLDQHCNQIDLLCQGQNVQCRPSITSLTSSEQSTDRRCACLPGFIPVYQRHLRYHECFRLLPSNQSECESCVASGGECYALRLDQDKPTGCECPNDLDPLERLTGEDDGVTNDEKEMKDGNECSKRLVHVACRSKELSVCYQPSTKPYYSGWLSDSLESGDTIAVIDDLDGVTSHSNCRLLPPQSMINETSSWCRTLKWKGDGPPCAIRVTNYVSGDLYSGHLVIASNPIIPRMKKNMLFQFTCKTNENIHRSIPGQVFERSWTSEQEFTYFNSPWSKVDVRLKVLDQFGQEMAVLDDQPIKLIANLILSNNEQSTTVDSERDDSNKSAPFTAMAVEECHVTTSDHSMAVGAKSRTAHPIMILMKGCLDDRLERVNVTNQKPTGSTAIRISTNMFNQFETALFHLPVDWEQISQADQDSSDTSSLVSNGDSAVSPSQFITIDCLIRLCQQRAWCSWFNKCHSIDGQTVQPMATFSPPNIRTLTRSIQLKLVEKLYKTPDTDTSSLDCSTSFCLTSLSKLLLLAFFAILLCLLLTFSIVFIATKCRSYVRRDQTNDSTLHTHSPKLLHRTLQAGVMQRQFTLGGSNPKLECHIENWSNGTAFGHHPNGSMIGRSIEQCQCHVPTIQHSPRVTDPFSYHTNNNNLEPLRDHQCADDISSERYSFATDCHQNGSGPSQKNVTPVDNEVALEETLLIFNPVDSRHQNSTERQDFKYLLTNCPNLHTSTMCHASRSTNGSSGQAKQPISSMSVYDNETIGRGQGYLQSSP